MEHQSQEPPTPVLVGNLVRAKQPSSLEALIADTTTDYLRFRDVVRDALSVTVCEYFILYAATQMQGQAFGPQYTTTILRLAFCIMTVLVYTFIGQYGRQPALIRFYRMSSAMAVSLLLIFWLVWTQLPGIGPIFATWRVSALGSVAFANLVGCVIGYAVSLKFAPFSTTAMGGALKKPMVTLTPDAVDDVNSR